MERKHFLKTGFSALGAVFVFPLMTACSKAADATAVSDGTGTQTGNTSCTVVPTETEGPFPTKSPATYVRNDITDGKAGAKMVAKITIGNVNNGCAGLANAIVDIWHCDADGNYSEYGGSGMQSVNYQSAHFLRGRQLTDPNGLVTFNTIFPGWYSGRATHIHVHVYTQAGNSLKVTQIAFADTLSKTVNSTGAAYGYTKGISGYTVNGSDNVFSDDKTGIELATVTGSLETGYELAIKINVAA
jgi:protocatechuate 3,4-dioxygenase beta subunit